MENDDLYGEGSLISNILYTYNVAYTCEMRE